MKPEVILRLLSDLVEQIERLQAENKRLTTENETLKRRSAPGPTPTIRR